MIADDALRVQSTKILDLVTAELASAAPDRRYITAGDENSVAWDDEQLTVCLAEATPQDSLTTAGARRPAPHHTAKSALLEARYAVELVQCVPTVEEGFPSAAELGAHGVLMHNLGTQLWNVVESGIRTGAIIPADRELAAARIDRVRFYGPQGGLSSARLGFTLTVI